MAEGLRLLEVGILADKPEYNVAYFLASATMGGGDRKRSAGLLERELAVHPQNTRAAYTLLNVYGLLKRWADEEELVSMLLENEPDNALLYYTLGLMRFNQENYPAAREAINAGLKLAPNVSILMLMDANLMAKEGDRDNGKLRFEKAKIRRTEEETLMKHMSEANRTMASATPVSVPGIPGMFVPPLGGKVTPSGTEGGATESANQALGLPY